MSLFIFLDFASIFDEAPSLSSLKYMNLFVSKTNNRLLVFIFLIALIDHSLDF